MASSRGNSVKPSGSRGVTLPTGAAMPAIGFGTFGSDHAGHDVVAEPQAVRRSLGFYSASTALYPRLTARETLAFFARIIPPPSSPMLRRHDEVAGHEVGPLMQQLIEGVLPVRARLAPDEQYRCR